MIEKFFKKIYDSIFGTVSIVVEDETKTVDYIKTKKSNQLTVSFKNGSYLAWFIDSWEGDNIVEPWKDFYNWYINEQTKIFIKHYDAGLTLLKRDEILTFNIEIKTRRV